MLRAAFFSPGFRVIHRLEGRGRKLARVEQIRAEKAAEVAEKAVEATPDEEASVAGTPQSHVKKGVRSR
ncbi:hypothetical protein FSARC_5414 [Fusarium sarcochroum]|uniref:Uncharacterized protein n=1 Tax=Fusarium sarcochroum TaxID=1208366 RepID=A0A8H4TZG7_9HYPO|nr:hypothetical protein FSARC_5414 [Fusarium sarcochroum]